MAQQSIISGYDEAVRLMSENRLLEAIVEMRRCADQDPDFLDARFNLGRIYRRLGRYEESLPMFEECLQDLPGDLDVLVETSETAFFSGDLEAVERFCGESCRLEVEAVDSRIKRMGSLLVFASLQSEGPKGALKRLKTYLKGLPNWTGPPVSR